MTNFYPLVSTMTQDNGDLHDQTCGSDSGYASGLDGYTSQIFNDPGGTIYFSNGLVWNGGQGVFGLDAVSNVQTMTGQPDQPHVTFYVASTADMVGDFNAWSGAFWWANGWQGSAFVDSYIFGNFASYGAQVQNAALGALGTADATVKVAGAIGGFLLPGGAEVAAAEGAAEGAASAANIANKINHIFREGKNLEGLVQASGGSAESAYTAVQQAANQALRDQLIVPGANGILPGGGAGAILNVNGVNVQLIGGRIINGAVSLGSFVGVP